MHQNKNAFVGLMYSYRYIWRTVIPGSYSKNMFIQSEITKLASRGAGPFLHSYQQCVSIPFAPHLCQHVLLSVFQIQAFQGEGNGNPLQYSCLENSMDGGAWQATVPVVAESWTRLSSFTSICIYWYSVSVSCSVVSNSV